MRLGSAARLEPPGGKLDVPFAAGKARAGHPRARAVHSRETVQR